MTTPLEVELCSIVAAIEADLELELPWLTETAQVMRQVDTALDHRSARLEALTRRWRRTLDAIERLRERGVLDDTQSLAIADLDGGE